MQFLSSFSPVSFAQSRNRMHIHVYNVWMSLCLFLFLCVKPTLCFTKLVFFFPPFSFFLFVLDFKTGVKIGSSNRKRNTVDYLRVRFVDRAAFIFTNLASSRRVSVDRFHRSRNVTFMNSDTTFICRSVGLSNRKQGTQKKYNPREARA